MSPEAQYIINLHAAGLEIGYQDPSLTLADRREQLDRYRSHWDSLQWVEHTSLPLPFHKNRVIQGGIVCFTLLGGPGDLTTDYRFIRLPSVLKGIPLKEWTLHGLPHNPDRLGILPEEDLLVVCTPVHHERPFLIELLRMSDGQPHPSAFVPTIGPPGHWQAWTDVVIEVQLTSSRLAITILTFISNPPRISRFVVWDWKTGIKCVDIVRHSHTVQFVDEYRIFGVSETVDPYSRWSVTLLDTSAPAEDPQKPTEIEFRLDHVESLDGIYLGRGTYIQETRQGSPFRTDRKKHMLRLKCVSAPGYTPPTTPEFVIDYGSISAIASENESTSCIPWDFWKHKVVPFDQHVESAAALYFVGPRMLAISTVPYQGPSLHSFDFTPGACRLTKQIDASLDDEPRYAIRRAKLTDMFPDAHMMNWAFSEDNVLAFTQSSNPNLETLEIWTF